jgi:membrane protease YdiL (CAAX protease family)
VGAAHSDGQPEAAEATDPGHGEAAEQHAATENQAPVPQPPGAAPVTEPPAGNPGVAVPVPASSPGGISGAAGVPPYPSSGNGAAPYPGSDAQFPPAGAAVPPPGWQPGWPPPGPGAPPYATGSPSYPPGPYPPTGPYPAPSIGRTPPRGTSWAAPSPTRTHRWGLGAYLLAEVVFLLTSALIGIVLVGDAGPTATTLAVALAVPTVLAASTALLITWMRGNGPRIDLGLVWSWRDLRIGLAFGFGGLALTIPASMVYVAIVGEDATSAVGDVFGGIRAGPALAALVLFIVVIIAPMCEEILYRGLLWGGIEKLAGRWVAFAVSTLLFAIAHFEFTRTPLLLVVAIPIAIARLYTGRLLASIVAHQVNNLLPGVALVLGLLGVVPMA